MTVLLWIAAGIVGFVLVVLIAVFVAIWVVGRKMK